MDKKDFLDLVDIVSQYVQLAPEGDSHYLGQCPFCSAKDSLILSVDNQFWSCLSCGADGDRYDFVAKSENISRAEAILMIGHHTNTGEPFPHARFTPGKPAPKVEETRRPAAPPPPKPEAAKAPAAPTPTAPAPGAEKGLLKPFLEFRNIIPSYQGAALLDDRSAMIISDSEYSSSADLVAIGGFLAPALGQAAALFSNWGMGTAPLPAQLILASEDAAILAHKFGPAAHPRLLLIRLANPAEVPVARRLVASASAKLT